MARNYNTALFFELKANAQQFNSELKKANTQFNSFTTGISKAARFAGGAFLASEIAVIGKEIINTRAEFQKFEAVLTNTLGSNSQAQSSLKTISDFAAKTPFQVDEITDAFVKLANRGVKLSVQQMQEMGDVAAALGKPFAKLNEAILDVNSTERWTELGIKVRTEGESIIGTFKGVEVQVERTEAGALEMISAFAKLDGVAGTTEAISKTLGVQISNLKDNFALLKNEIGKLVEDEGAGFIGFLNDAVGGVKDFIAQINDPAGAFGQFVNTGDNYADQEKALAKLLLMQERLRKTANQFEGQANQSGIIRSLQQVTAAIDQQRASMEALVKAGEEGKKEIANTTVNISSLNDEIKKLQERQSLIPIEEVGKIREAGEEIERLQKQIENLLKAPEQSGIIEKLNQEIEKYSNLANNAFDEAEITKYNDKITELRLELERLNNLTANVSPITDADVEKLKKFQDEFEFINDAILEEMNFAEEFNKEIDKLLDENGIKKFQDRTNEMLDINAAFTAALQASMEEAANMIGRGLGDALSGKDVDFGKGLFTLLASVAQKLGETAIAIGVSIAGINTAIRSLQPIPAIAAGVALVALSAAIKNGLVADSVGMMNGGIVPSGFPNDTYRARLTSGEVVIPPKKLDSIINRSSGKDNFVVSTEFKYDRLAVYIRREEEKRKKLG